MKKTAQTAHNRSVYASPSIRRLRVAQNSSRAYAVCAAFPPPHFGLAKRRKIVKNLTISMWMVIVGKGEEKRRRREMKTSVGISPKAPFTKELSAKLTEDLSPLAPS